MHVNFKMCIIYEFCAATNSMVLVCRLLGVALGGGILGDSAFKGETLKTAQSLVDL